MNKLLIGLGALVGTLYIYGILYLTFGALNGILK